MESSDGAACGVILRVVGRPFCRLARRDCLSCAHTESDGIDSSWCPENCAAIAGRASLLQHTLTRCTSTCLCRPWKRTLLKHTRELPGHGAHRLCESPSTVGGKRPKDAHRSLAQTGLVRWLLEQGLVASPTTTGNEAAPPHSVAVPTTL